MGKSHYFDWAIFNSFLYVHQRVYDGIWLNYYPIIFLNILFHLKQGQWSPLGCVSFGTHWNSSIGFVSLSCVSRFSLQINVHFHQKNCHSSAVFCSAHKSGNFRDGVQFSFGGGFGSHKKPDRGFVQSLQELASAHGEESVIMVSHRAWMDEHG